MISVIKSTIGKASGLGARLLVLGSLVFGIQKAPALDSAEGPSPLDRMERIRARLQEMPEAAEDRTGIKLVDTATGWPNWMNWPNWNNWLNWPNWANWFNA